MSTDWLDIMREKVNVKVRKHSIHDEDVLQMSCRTWFDLRYPHLKMLLHHSPNEGLLVNKARDGAKRKAMGVRAGFPDFIFLYPSKGVPFLCLELKTETGRQSHAQKNYQQLVESVGAKYCIVRSFVEFVQSIEEYINE